MNVWNVENEEDIAALERQLREPATVLSQGGLVAFPTETVYGLGADATNERAVRGIFAAKSRPADNPLIVHIADVEMLPSVIANSDQLPAPARKAMDVFWPGPLTLILPASERIAPSVRPGTDTVGVRMPNHAVARTLIRLAGCPVAAPSANKSGKPSPTTAGDVLEDMEGVIDGVVDGGPCDVGVESTVVTIEEERGVIYRPGGVTKEQLEEALAIPISLDPHLTSPTQAPKAPGMKYRHYAPNASVHVWWGEDEAVQRAFAKFCDEHKGEALAAIVPAGGAYLAPGANPVWTAPAEIPYAVALSRELYRLLRYFDRAGARHVLIVGVPPYGIGAAVMNRLQKASEGRLYHV
jgi:L-threonylcarbamoyladenylate synthase